MSESRGTPLPPELPNQQSDEGRAVAPEDEQEQALASSDQQSTKRPPLPSEDEQQKALAALLAQKINEIAALPDDEKQREITAVISHTQIYSGPLPSPEAFARYNEVLPNAADRILGMAEKEQEIRHEAQRGSITNDRHRIRAALFVALAIVGVAGLATWFGQAWIAVPLGLAGVLGTFVRWLVGRRRESK